MHSSNINTIFLRQTWFPDWEKKQWEEQLNLWDQPLPTTLKKEFSSVQSNYSYKNNQ